VSDATRFVDAPSLSVHRLASLETVIVSELQLFMAIDLPDEKGFCMAKLTRSAIVCFFFVNCD